MTAPRAVSLRLLLRPVRALVLSTDAEMSTSDTIGSYSQRRCTAHTSWHSSSATASARTSSSSSSTVCVPPLPSLPPSFSPNSPRCSPVRSHQSVPLALVQPRDRELAPRVLDRVRVRAPPLPLGRRHDPHLLPRHHALPPHRRGPPSRASAPLLSLTIAPSLARLND